MSDESKPHNPAVHAKRNDTPAAPPRPPAHFAGRKDELDKLIQALVAGESVAVTALQGMGGIGKTALAQKVAERLSPHFPGGVLWWTLGPSADVYTALDVWARHAEPRSDLSRLPDAEARANAVRAMLGRLGRLCAILDDVWDEAAARVLLGAIPPGCPVLLTTRNADLAENLRCRVERLGVLSADESVQLLANLLGPLGAHEPAAREIATLTDGLPLALEIIAGLADSPADLPVLAQKLKQQKPLDILKLGSDAGREHSVEACFALSYDALDVETQRCFRALGVFAPAAFDEAAVLAVWGDSPSSPRPPSPNLGEGGARPSIPDERAIGEGSAHPPLPVGEGPGVRENPQSFLKTLTRRALLTKTGDGAYTQHTLLRTYALALLERAGEHTEYAARHAEHYRRFAEEKHWREVEGAFEQIKWGWRWVQQHARDRLVDYALAVDGFLRTRGRNTELLEWLNTALAQAREAKRRKDEGALLNNIGAVYDALGQKGKALVYYEQALDIRREVGDRSGEGTTLNNIGAVYDALGQKGKALVYYEQALEIHWEVGNRPMEGTTLN
ncbi:MAG: NB-ARC domain-containing protein, partial [Anaerolineales bacterium]|nr:NB-ARC domain-containing protein [Anaerolineales bacterium]